MASEARANKIPFNQALNSKDKFSVCVRYKRKKQLKSRGKNNISKSAEMRRWQRQFIFHQCWRSVFVTFNLRFIKPVIGRSKWTIKGLVEKLLGGKFWGKKRYGLRFEKRSLPRCEATDVCRMSAKANLRTTECAVHSLHLLPHLRSYRVGGLASWLS